MKKVKRKLAIIGSAMLMMTWMGTSFVAESRAQNQLQRIRFGIHANYVRIVFDFDRPVPYNLDYQPDEQMLYIELFNCDAPAIPDGFQTLSSNTAVHSMFVKRLNPKKLLVRLEGTAAFNYQVDELEEPWRLVLDIAVERKNELPQRLRQLKQPRQSQPISSYQQGLKMLEQQKPDQAIAAFQTATANRNYASLAHFQLGQLYYDKSEQIKALDHFEKVAANSPLWKQAQRQISRIQDEILADAKKELAQIPAKKDTLGPQQSQTPGNIAPISDQSRVEVAGQPNEAPSLTSIMLLAMVVNIVIFVVFISATRRFKKKRKQALKYKKVTASTKKTVLPKSKPKPKFEQMVQDEMQRQPDATPVHDILMASPKAADHRYPKHARQSNAYSDMVPRKEKTTPEVEETKKEQFEISDQPIEKVESAYYKNILQTTMGQYESGAPTVSNLRPAYDELIDQIEQLLAYNFDVKTIAKELGLGQDEVRMMLNLRRTRVPKSHPEHKNNPDKKTNRITFA